jgi:hypothetical protein
MRSGMIADDKEFDFFIACFFGFSPVGKGMNIEPGMIDHLFWFIVESTSIIRIILLFLNI